VKFSQLFIDVLKGIGCVSFYVFAVFVTFYND